MSDACRPGPVRRAGRAAGRGLRHAFYHVVAIPLLCVACKVWFGFRTVGEPRRSLPRGGCVVVANHVHYLDCAMIGVAVWPRRVTFLVDRRNWDHPVIGVFMRLFECIPTGETIAQTRAMLCAVREVPRRGHALAVFPEGELSCYREGLAPFKPGAFSVAAHAGVPIVPVVLRSNPRARGLCRLFGRPGFTVVRGAALASGGADGGPVRGRVEGLEEHARTTMEGMLRG